MNSRNRSTNINNICTQITDYTIVPSDYVVIDFETTGLRENDSRIIQVAAYRYRDHIKVDELVSYVNPKVHIPVYITEITGITDAHVKESPAIEAVLPELVEFITGEVVVGHNVPFDLRFLVYNAEEYKLQLPHIRYVDTLRLSRRYIKGVKNYKLETLKDSLGIVASSHSADEDCYVCGEVYRKCAILAK